LLSWLSLAKLLLPAASSTCTRRAPAQHKDNTGDMARHLNCVFVLLYHHLASKVQLQPFLQSMLTSGSVR
jgi:hypothetical protein